MTAEREVCDLDQPPIRLCLAKGYRLAGRGRLNAILARGE